MIHFGLLQTKKSILRSIPIKMSASIERIRKIVYTDFPVLKYEDYFFVFTNKSRDCLKAVNFKGNSVEIYFKKLDGSQFLLPRSNKTWVSLSADQMIFLFRLTSGENGIILEDNNCCNSFNKL